ncbi:hypothetical protein [Nocardioides sp.]|uniref:hypothetical protein n=1 Tax=Nocardioides sp. TaxID=35761 RepID=UPI003565E142
MTDHGSTRVRRRRAFRVLLGEVGCAVAAVPAALVVREAARRSAWGTTGIGLVSGPVGAVGAMVGAAVADDLETAVLEPGTRVGRFCSGFCVDFWAGFSAGFGPAF